MDAGWSHGLRPPLTIGLSRAIGRAGRSGCARIELAIRRLFPAGTGIALKIDDGAYRAAEAAIRGVFKHLGLLDWFDPSLIETQWAGRLTNSAGQVISKIAATEN